MLLLAEQPYIITSGSQLTIATPAGGSMTFIEGANQWTFDAVSSTAQAYTDNQVTQTITQALSAATFAQQTAQAYTDQQVSSTQSSMTSYTNSLVSTSASGAKSYTDSATTANSLATAALSTSTSQSISTTKSSLAATIASVNTTVQGQLTTLTTTTLSNAATLSTGVLVNINTVNFTVAGIRTDLTTTIGSLGGLTNTVTATVQPAIASAQVSIAAVTAGIASTVTVANTLTSSLSTASSTVTVHTASISSHQSSITVQDSSISYLNNRLPATMSCMQNGYGYSQVNQTCWPTTQFTFSRYYGDVRTVSDSWIDLAGRTLSFYKSSTSSVLEVTYMDVLGFNMPGSQVGAYRWQLVIDNVVQGYKGSSITDNGVGWRITPVNQQWLVYNLPAGNHYAKIQIVRYSTTCNEPLAGWGGGSIENSLTAREIVLTNMTRVFMLGDVRMTQATWLDISGRALTVVKKSASTDLWVYYMDDLGMLMTGGSDAQSFRLTVGGNAQLESRMYSQSIAGWYIMPFNLMW